MDRPSDPVESLDPTGTGERKEPLNLEEADARFGADLCRELLRSQFGERYLGRSNGGT